MEIISNVPREKYREEHRYVIEQEIHINQHNFGGTFHRKVNSPS